jgi:hypothetical protein
MMFELIKDENLTPDYGTVPEAPRRKNKNLKVVKD